MKKESLKYEIVKYVENYPTGVFGGVVEDYIRQTIGAKGDTTARRLRELSETDTSPLICLKRKIENKGNDVNFYVLRRPPQVPTKFKRESVAVNATQSML